jgi:hypothetical protein
LQAKLHGFDTVRVRLHQRPASVSVFYKSKERCEPGLQVFINDQIPYLRNPRKYNLNLSINFNGILIDPHTPIATAFNRSTLETDYLKQCFGMSPIQNHNFHLDRLFHSADLHLICPAVAGIYFEEIKALIIMRGKTSRIRLNVYRGGTSLPSE